MSDPMPNKGCTHIETCEPSCPCQRVHIVHCDAEGEPEYTISMDPQIARAFARDMLHIADIAEAQQAKNAGRLA